jgi:hypothetical protein
VKKVVGLFKKREGMSDEDFRDHFETTHVHLFDEYLKMPGVKAYRRRYLKPIAAAITGEVHDESDFDVIMELWSDDEWFEYWWVGQPPAELRQLVAEDEEKLFDRDSMQLYVVDEVETDLAALREGER